MDSLQSVIAKLEDLFSKFNEKFFGGELVKPIIMVSPEKPRKNWSTYGWCTSWKAWNRGGMRMMVTMKFVCALNT